MVRVVPDGEDGINPAESAVVEALCEQLPDEATVLVNLHIVTRDGDREADAVVVWPEVGVAVIEVKGGHVEYADGTWWSGRPGKSRRLRPVQQAMECKHGIRKVLSRHPRWSGGDPRIVHHVALPHTTLPAGFVAPECPPGLITDKSNLPQLTDRLAAQLAAAPNGVRPVTPEEAKRLVTALTGPQRPQADFATSNAANLAERDAYCEQLTAKQAKVLDYVREEPRVQILGGAGTGKTWLAVEQARRLTSAGQRVALICYSRGLATWLKRRIKQCPIAERPAYVGSFHSLGVKWGSRPAPSAPQQYFDYDLPAEMLNHARHLVTAQRYDAVIIDEAQDFAPTWWEPVFAALKDSASSRLVIFADDDQAVFPRGDLPTAGFVKIVLDENLRNTEPIMRAFTPYGSRPLVSRGGDGVDVSWVATSTDSALAAADAEVRRLLDKGWAPEHVMLLSTKTRHPEHVRRQDRLRTDGYWDSFWDTDDVFYGTVLGSKGLERPAVVLAVNGFADAGTARPMLYVGMSRARDLLVVCGPR